MIAAQLDAIPVLAVVEITNVSTESITFKLTKDCNYNCPWCIDKYLYKDNEIDPVENYSIFLKYINEHKNLSDITISGGEPFLYPDKLFNLIKVVKEILPSAKINILTNASLLDKEIVYKIQKYDIKLIISLNLFGYKSLEKLITSAKDSKNIIDYIKSTDHELRIVIPRLQKFAVECCMLHEYFNCNCKLVPDYTTLNQWTDDDIDLIKNEFLLLKKLDKNCADWLKIGLSTRQLCNCSLNSKVMYTDGTCKSLLDNCTNLYKNTPIYGCLYFFNNTDISIYNQYAVLCNNFYNDYL